MEQEQHKKRNSGNVRNINSPIAIWPQILIVTSDEAEQEDEVLPKPYTGGVLLSSVAMVQSEILLFTNSRIRTINQWSELNILLCSLTPSPRPSIQSRKPYSWCIVEIYKNRRGIQSGKDGIKLNCHSSNGTLK